MKKIYKDFFKLLRSSLEKETVVIEEDIDWLEILRLSSIHKIIPLTYESACKTQSFQNENIQFVKYFKAESMEIIYSQVKRSYRFLQLYRELNQANIKALVFKGIVLRELYPVPEERISADEDLLIEKKDLEKTIKILELNNMERVFSDEDEADVYHYFCNKSGLHLEFHTTLFGDKSDINKKMEEVFSTVFQDVDKININNVDVHIFSIDKHFLYIICHAIKHFVSCGTGIRQICDISMYINKYYEIINWDYIWFEINKMGYDTLLVNLLQIAIDYLGLDENKVVYAKNKNTYYLNVDDLIEDIMEGGIYGTSTQARLNAANISLDALNKESKSKIKSNIAAIFPKAENLKGRYKYLEKYPVLLPVAWGSRILTYSKERGSLSSLGATAKETIEVGNRRIDLLKEYKLIE
ncbi:nucleotidyltransferase family protein [Terrisporobacter petrolearius]|uniref:nucleotidyltransferase domain-containing protein n=1 Tax=Terrisporobacter petrolearius TaxID=1460447 RepID=UPI001D16A0FA|nr:nucleotidyltransferase family protein [Terrisporobacter petrolearius]MCC3862701.1 nucleotidyltransferase family protein [Terrisporobacter petrolearius]